MSRTLLQLALGLVIISALSQVASAQGRGKGQGLGRRSDIFDDRGQGRNNGRRNQDWKCGKFVNCHDARDGRLDGRGPNRSTGFWRNGVARGANVGNRKRFNTNDYWRRRHVMYRTSNLNERRRYRSGAWRNR